MNDKSITSVLSLNDNVNLKSNAKSTDMANVEDNASSSDMELPALVSEAIRRVESESDADSTRAVPQVQYTSSLLQDFIAKAQMLGNPSASSDTKNGAKLEQSIAQKKRGRPKSQSQASSSNNQLQGVNCLISESPDSGILSTVSPAPSPRVTDISKAKYTKPESSSKKLKQSLAKSPTPKYNLADIEKSTYATERVLYPPRRKKGPGRPSKETCNKKDDTLDPLWKKIDLNKKFREPCLDGYRSDGGHSICSKRLAAQSGYVSDYYGSSNKRNLSGYKSDHSMKSRRSDYQADRSIRAKSCGYRSDCSIRYRKKVRRKRRKKIGISSKTGIDELSEILQLGALTLGTSSNTSSSRESIPSQTNQSTIIKKIEKPPSINTFNGMLAASKPKFGSAAPILSLSLGQASAFGKKMTIQKSTKLPLSRANVQKNAEEHAKRKASTKDLLDSLCERVTQHITKPVLSVKSSKSIDGRSMKSRKTIHNRLRHHHDRTRECSASIRSRRLSTMSRCSSRSTISRHHFKRRRRKRLKSRSVSMSGQNKSNDNKLLADVEQLSESFNQLCKIYIEKGDKALDKPVRISGSTKRGPKKRKQNETVDVSAASSGTTGTKRRNKKTQQLTQSPDDHKLPLKKRHYLLANGDKAEISDDDIPENGTRRKSIHDAKEVERIKAHYDEAIEACINKYASNSPVSKSGNKDQSKSVSPKKRHLLKTADGNQALHKSLTSPLTVDTSITTGSSSEIPQCSLTKNTFQGKKYELAARKKNRLENVISKISPNTELEPKSHIENKGNKKMILSPDSKTVTKKLRSDPSNFKAAITDQLLPIDKNKKVPNIMSPKKGKTAQSISINESQSIKGAAIKTARQATNTSKNVSASKKSQGLFNFQYDTFAL